MKGETEAMPDATCPPEEALTRMLDDGLDDTEAGGIGSHVASCPACLGKLGRLTAPPTEAFSGPLSGPTRTDVDTLETWRGPGPGPGPARLDDHGYPEIPGYRIERELGRGGAGWGWSTWPGRSTPADWSP